MKSNIYLKDKKSHLSNHKLIGYMVDIGSRFIDLLIKAFKNKNIHQKFRISKNGRIVDNLKSNQYERINQQARERKNRTEHSYEPEVPLGM
jgi:hypothetical protein